MRISHVPQGGHAARGAARRRFCSECGLSPPSSEQPPWHRQFLPAAAGMVQSVPHALDEHVPALAGPLRVVSAGQPPGEQASQLVQMAGGSDAAQALLLTR